MKKAIGALIHWTMQEHVAFLALLAVVLFAATQAVRAAVSPPQPAPGYDWQWLIRIGPEECVEYTGNAGTETYQLQAYYLAPGFTSLQDAAVYAIQAYELDGPMAGGPFVDACAVPVAAPFQAARGGQGVVR